MSGWSRQNERLLVALALLSAQPVVHGGVLEFDDKDAWIAAVGEFTTIDFTGFPDGTFITNEYAGLGVLFTDGNDSIDATCAHVNDCFGLDGNPSMHLSFDSPQAYLAVDFPGDVQIDLFNEDQLIHSALFIGGGLGFFFGVVSTELFDTVVISRPFGTDALIDDLHFGVPACPIDLDGDRIVAVPDLLLLLGNWGPCP